MSRWRWTAPALAACVVLFAPVTAFAQEEAAAAPENFGILSLLPPLLAVILAIVTRRVVTSLVLGVAIGALLIKHWSFWPSVGLFFEGILWPQLIDPDHMRVIAFTSLMGAMVGIMHRSGGMTALVAGIARYAKTRRAGQVTGWFLGLLIFFDDYANTLLLGTTFQPVVDRLKISRAKLSYIVDSTAAPVAGVALVSTWVATEINYIQEGFATLGAAGEAYSAFDLFLESLPFRFYPWLALWFVLIVALMNRDFGPMRKAEAEAQAQHKAKNKSAGGHEQPKASWASAVLPVLVVLVVLTVLILQTGSQKIDDPDALSWTEWLRESILQCDSYLALVYASLAGVAIAWLLARRTLDQVKVAEAAMGGAKSMLPALVVLWLAWSLATVTNSEHLNTAQFVGESLQSVLQPELLPTLAFIVSAIVAFCTGTSWGTMGILMPLVVRITFQLLAQQEPPDGSDPILAGTIGSVLAGSIFGDHCSPISDTTVLSAQASGCPIVEHVHTQLPYAVVVGLVSVLCGTLPIGWGVSVWVCLPLGCVALAAILWFLGKETAES